MPGAVARAVDHEVAGRQERRRLGLVLDGRRLKVGARSVVSAST